MLIDIKKHNNNIYHNSIISQIRKHSRLPAEQSREIFHKAYAVSIVDEAFPLMLSLSLIINQYLGKILHLCRPFCWHYPEGGKLNEHMDREEGMWSISVPLYYGGPIWDLYIKDTPYKLDIGQGLLMNGGRDLHHRPYYEHEAIILMLSYRENLESARNERNKYLGKFPEIRIDES